MPMTLPYVLTNGAVADASQVNANFNALASGTRLLRANGSLPSVASGMPMTTLASLNVPAGDWDVRGWVFARLTMATPAPFWLGLYIESSGHDLWSGGANDARFPTLYNGVDFSVTAGPISFNTQTLATLILLYGWGDSGLGTAQCQFVLEARRIGDYRTS